MTTLYSYHSTLGRVCLLDRPNLSRYIPGNPSLVMTELDNGRCYGFDEVWTLTLDNYRYYLPDVLILRLYDGTLLQTGVEVLTMAAANPQLTKTFQTCLNIPVDSFYPVDEIPAAIEQAMTTEQSEQLGTNLKKVLRGCYIGTTVQGIADRTLLDTKTVRNLLEIAVAANLVVEDFGEEVVYTRA